MFHDNLQKAVIAMKEQGITFLRRFEGLLPTPTVIPRSSLGGYNRHRAVTAAASKRAAAKRRNLRKRSPH